MRFRFANLILVVAGLAAAGCGDSSRVDRLTAEVAALKAQLSTSQPGKLDAAPVIGPALAIDREKIVSSIDQREKGVFEFELQKLSDRNRWMASGAPDVPLTILLNEDTNGKIQSVDLTYFVHSDAPPSSVNRVAEVYAAIVSSVIGPGFQRDGKRAFIECIGREHLPEHSDAVLTLTLNGVDISAKYNHTGKMHDWTFKASTNRKGVRD